MPISAADFSTYFESIHGEAPFPWQARLAKQVCETGWPKAIALPTAAGKTACIDIAVFALACQAPNAARRIFFVVDRRIVVDQAYRHAKKLVDQIRQADSGILNTVKQSLVQCGGEPETPLDAYALRGGIYRETAWARSPIQPLVITSTVDQVGSRLLFRGYGVSNCMKPIHAGLVGNDSLILLDEAHCSHAFNQTLQAVEHFRTPQWSSSNQKPASFGVVSLSATPSQETLESDLFRDNDDDRNHAVLGPRFRTSKPAKLVVAEKAQKGKWQAELVKELASQARSLMGQSLGTDDSGHEHQAKAIGIVVNRVATARELAEVLQTPQKKQDSATTPQVVLLTGRMRAIDRNERLREIEHLLAGKQRGECEPIYVVATQCIEVGADLDFHALVTECASLDAIRQRFGRLNRIAGRPSSLATVVVRGDQTEFDLKRPDPVYGESLPATWQFLNQHASNNYFDFGINAFAQFNDQQLRDYCVQPKKAPVLFASHLDCLVQTSPIPTPDVDPAPYLHGENQRSAEVQLVFRSDLDSAPESLWKEIVSLCPPSSGETLSVPIHQFRNWIAQGSNVDETSDIEGSNSIEDELHESMPSITRWLRWAGPDSERTNLVFSPRDVQPGDTFVAPCTTSNLRDLGDFGQQIPADHSQLAFTLSRARAFVRLPDLEQKDVEDREDSERNILIDEALDLLFTNDAMLSQWPPAIHRSLKNYAHRDVIKHPAGGYVVIGRRPIPRETLSHLIPQFAERIDSTYLDDSEPVESIRAARSVTLREHSNGVAKHAKIYATHCSQDTELFEQVGWLHDIGKLEPRNQAMLRGISYRLSTREPLAKSGNPAVTDRELHQFPPGARHELMSVAMLKPITDDDLLLYLIATHHGFARPFAPPVDENNHFASPYLATFAGETFSLSSSQHQPDQWNSDLAPRFWRVIRKFGWWGSAYLESLIRLADHMQSRIEQVRPQTEAAPVIATSLPPKSSSLPTSELTLEGLQGNNPLAFLAALGTLRILSLVEPSQRPDWLPQSPTLSWSNGTNQGIAILHLHLPIEQAALTEFLATQLKSQLKNHPAQTALGFMSSKANYDRTELQHLAADPQREQEALWSTSLFVEMVPNATSQLLVVRGDYVEGNFASIMARTAPQHLDRTLFNTWDYADALDNQSLHWEPSEDRRHAYQWHEASGDPTRKKRGGMLGANRLALEAWPLFQSFPNGDRILTVGFTGNRVSNTRWSWPLWSCPADLDTIKSLLSLPDLQEETPSSNVLTTYQIFQVNRSQRILVQKTPNLTPAYAV